MGDPSTRIPSSTLITINGHEFSVDSAAVDAIHRVRHKDKSRRIWIDRICINQDDAAEIAEQPRFMKRINESATGVILWIGGHEEKTDSMNAYLGLGTLATTEHAFGFAKALSSASGPSEIKSVTASEFPPTKLPSWCYLARLLYRPWFRELPLLRTSYVEDLSSVSVLCGGVSIPWTALSKAAESIRTTNPLPRFFHHANLEPHSHLIWPGMSMESVLQWFRDRERFGFSPAHMATQICWVLEQTEDDEQESQLAALLGVADEAFDLDNGLLAELRRHLEALKTANAHNDAGGVDGPTKSLKQADPLPSLPFKGYLSLAPLAEDQAPFVHGVRRQNEMRLLVLVPHHGAHSSPIQCGLIHISRDSPPPYAYVLNATLPKPPRRTTSILLNGQSLCVSKAFEIFLRHLRHPRDEHLLFVWPICEDPKYAINQSRGPIEGYTIGKQDVYFPKASATVDLYEVLERARETQAEMLPEGLSWDEWLMELND
jgi:hypothetical protein